MIELSVKIPLKTYRNFIYAQIYRRGSTILVTTIGVINLAAYVLYLAGPLRDVLSSPAVSLIFGLVLTFGVPLVIHYSTASTFLTNKYLQEECSWTISRQGIQINGQTFTTQFDWSYIHKIRQLNNVVAIYHDGTVANMIPFEAFRSYGDFEKFWAYIKENNIPTK